MLLKVLLPCLGLMSILTIICTEDMSSDTIEKVNGGFEGGLAVLDGIMANIDEGGKLFKKLGKLAGVLGAAGGLLSFALLFVETESAEMTFMKEKFAEVNMKLDVITEKLGKIENVVVYENQRSAYIQYSTDINNGYKELNNFLKESLRLKCPDKQACKKIRLGIASRYVKKFDIKNKLITIIDGAIKGTKPFGDAMLHLVGTTSKCDVGKIQSFSTQILLLALKAQEVIMAHETLTGSNFSIVQSMDNWLKSVYELRDAKNKEVNLCYNNIKKYMLENIQDKKYQVGVSSNKEANTKLKGFLDNKYRWLDWIIYSYGAYDGANHFIEAGRYGKFWSMPKDQNERKRNIIVGAIDKAGTYDDPKTTVLNAMNEIVLKEDVKRESGNAGKMLKKIVSEIKSKGAWQFIFSINVLRKYDGLELSSASDKCYIDQVYPISGSKIRIIVILRSKETAAGNKCDLTCNHHGTCINLPLTSNRSCQCKPYYQGEQCNAHDSIELAKTMENMLQTTLKLPVLSDLKGDIEEMRESIGISIGKVQLTIAELEVAFQNALQKLAQTIHREFEWSNLVTQYASSITNIRYYSELFEYLQKSHPKNTKIEGRRLATVILASDGIRKWLYEINFLFLGRYGLSIVSHKPLMMHLLEKYNNQSCDKRYKSAILDTWKELVLLQQVGYMVFSQALEYSGKSAKQAAKAYKERVDVQTKKLREMSCKYEINHSNDKHCQNGKYLHPDLTTVFACRANYYRLAKVTTCKNKTSACKPCNCNPNGSKSLRCKDWTGNCSCKSGFYGKRCQNRDCSFEWKYSQCSKSCGEVGTKSGTLKIINNKEGAGKQCPSKKRNSISCFRCCNKKFQCGPKGTCISSSLRCNYVNDCGNKADEKYCSEKCIIKHTQWSSYSRFYLYNLYPLTKHRMHCGRRGYVLQKFKLEKLAWTNKIRYKYTCCKLFSSPAICSNRVKRSRFSYAKTVYLSRQVVNCGRGSLINAVQLKRYRRFIRYTYKCCKLKREYPLSCIWRRSAYTKSGGGRIYYLKKQSVQCPKRYFISYFRLQMTKSKRWRYLFKCCRVKVR